MTQELTTLKYDARNLGESYLVFRFVVKKVNVILSFYLQGRDEQGHVKTIYVGSLEKIEKYYLVNVKSEGFMVDRPGFEPGTSRMPTERSSELSYRPFRF